MIGRVDDHLRRDLDVDARFLLANERTLLAWLRTTLALLAGGVGVYQFGTDVPASTLWAELLLATGGASGVIGIVRYISSDRAIRRGELPPGVHMPLVVAGAVVALAAALIVAVAFA